MLLIIDRAGPASRRPPRLTSNVRPRLRQPAVLLFDLGGVLVENVGFERFNALLPSPIPSEELKTQWLASPAVRSFEAGNCTPEVFARKVVTDWQLPLTPAAFLECEFPRNTDRVSGSLIT